MAEPTPSRLLSALDDGASGVLVPHVDSVQRRPREVVAACRYRGGKRGFSNSPRAAAIWRASASGSTSTPQDAEVTVIAMIEDPEALDEIEAIAAVDGVDGFFIGRGDLTVALGAPAMDAPEILDAVKRIAGRGAGRRQAGLHDGGERRGSGRRSGRSAPRAFIVSSDQGFMRQAAGKVLSEFARPESVKP